MEQKWDSVPKSHKELNQEKQFLKPNGIGLRGIWHAEAKSDCFLRAQGHWDQLGFVKAAELRCTL